jgi:hypothetical protein
MGRRRAHPYITSLPPFSWSRNEMNILHQSDRQCRLVLLALHQLQLRRNPYQRGGVFCTEFGEQIFTVRIYSRNTNE